MTDIENSLKILKEQKKFNYDIADRIIEREYNKLPYHPYSCNEVIEIFNFYFTVYKYNMLTTHPKLKPYQISHIIQELPSVENCYGECVFFEPADYYKMINKYFSTPIRCDRNILHFMSGNIRLNRYYDMYR